MKRPFADYLLAAGRLSEQRLRSISHDEWVSREPIGRLALLHGLLAVQDIDHILHRQRTEQKYFGEIAMEMGLMTEAQLRVLLAGQGVRACIELTEDLALSGQMDMAEGLIAMSQFASSEEFSKVFEADTARAM